MYTTEFFDKVDELAKRSGFKNEYLIIAVTNDGVPTCNHVWPKGTEPKIKNDIGKVL